MKHLLYIVWDFEGGDDGKGCWIVDSTGFDWWYIPEDGKVVLVKYPLTHRHCSIVPYTPGRFSILLWTGTKDKNGNNIYDGHIIKLWTYVKPVVIKWPHDCNDFKKCVFDSCDIKIIGHIHTDPDLVRKKGK